jgi:bifunctional UDP-N-acetylglucosamine pyrophosphorylase/glucosamine-1-phosphate N-acetyltransferase
MSAALIILAAGKGSRMKSDLPKVLHKLAGAPMLHHAMRTGQSIEPEHVIVVAGHGAEAVTKAAQDFNPDAQIVLQTEQNGTAHAAAQARDALKGFDGDAIVLFGDTPFISEKTLRDVVAARQAGADVVVLGFHAADPGLYGRLVTNGDTVEKIVEAKDASASELQIDLCNSGILAAKSDLLFDLIDAVTPQNAQGEYYLTDIVGIARTRGLNSRLVTCDESETLGINSRVQLSQAEALFQDKARIEAMDNGATMRAPETVFLAFDTVIGRDVTIGPNVVFGAGVTIESGATIRAFSHLEDAHVASGAIVGPYARLRPGAEIGNDAKIGNFVEIKSARIHDGAKVNHLTYIGNADIGKATNVGAGVVTCNYDGVFKHQTTIGERAFIGTNSTLVAPLTIEDDAFIAAGSTITQSVPSGDLALGRAQQVNKSGYGAKLVEMLRSIKATGKRP